MKEFHHLFTVRKPLSEEKLFEIANSRLNDYIGLEDLHIKYANNLHIQIVRYILVTKFGFKGTFAYRCDEIIATKAYSIKYYFDIFAHLYVRHINILIMKSKANKYVLKNIRVYVQWFKEFKF